MELDSFLMKIQKNYFSFYCPPIYFYEGLTYSITRQKIKKVIKYKKFKYNIRREMKT